MRIQSMTVDLVGLPLDRPMQSEKYSISHIYHAVVRLRTDEGQEGFGYGLLLDARQAKALATLLRELEDVVVGQDPTLPEAVWGAVGRVVYLAGPSGLTLMAVSAIDIAVWDLFGKIVGQPLFRLLGGARTEVPAYFTGALTRSDPEGVVAEAQALVEQGLTAFKLGAGPDIDQTVARVSAVRETVGPQVKILLDNVEGWKPSEAIQLGRRLEEHRLFWFEDPVYHLDYAGLARVAAALDLPVCTGEYLYGLDGFRPLIEGQGADIVMIDTRRAGGVTAFKKIAALAEAWHLPVVPHFMPEVNAHLIAAISNGLIAEYVTWSLRLFREPLRPERGVIRLPERPGLGLELDPEALERFRV
jgi:L-alanine-DL-glutamate epimerase-like enolase superfamily enzyme